MIDQSLIDKCESEIDTFERISRSTSLELLSNYKSLIEQNAELHKELAKVKQLRSGVLNIEDELPDVELML